jgi:hypothetical protein
MKGSLKDALLTGDLKELGFEKNIAQYLIDDLKDALEILDNIYGDANRFKVDIELDIRELEHFIHNIGIDD